MTVETTSMSTGDVVNVFKKVYADRLRDLTPSNFPLERDIAFNQSEMVGDSFIACVCLTAETGWTIGGDTTEAFKINPAIAGTVKQTSVKPSAVVLTSIIPFGTASRSAKSETAFKSATKHIVRNNLKSHSKLLEIIRIHGRSAERCGYVGYATETYRGVSFTTGTGTVGGVAFTNGINSASKKIHLGRAFAPGIWVGNEGCIVKEIISSSGAVAGEGKLVSVDADNGIIEVDFTPTAASSTTSHYVCFDGMELDNDAIGIKKILATQTGTLFDINVAKYSLFRGNYVNCGATLFTFKWLNVGVAAAVNRGGLGEGDEGGGDLTVYVNSRTWSTLIGTEAGRRVYDSSYESATARNGARAIEFFTEAGKCTIKTHRMMMEKDAMALHLPDWTRSGSAEVSFNIPGIEKECIFPLENQAGFAFRSYSDQFVLCYAPARSIWWYGINDESAT